MNDNFDSQENLEPCYKVGIPIGIWVIIVYLICIAIFFAIEFGGAYIRVKVWPYSGIGIARWYSMSILSFIAIFFLIFSKKNTNSFYKIMAFLHFCNILY